MLQACLGISQPPQDLSRAEFGGFATVFQQQTQAWEKSDSIIVERRELCGRRGNVWREGGKLEAEYWLGTV